MPVVDGERGARPRINPPARLTKMTPCSVVAVGASGSLEDEAPCGLGHHWTWRVSY